MSNRLRVVGCVNDEISDTTCFDTQAEVDAYIDGWGDASEGIGGGLSSYAVCLENYEDYFGEGMPCEDEPELGAEILAVLNWER